MGGTRSGCVVSIDPDTLDVIDFHGVPGAQGKGISVANASGCTPAG